MTHEKNPPALEGEDWFCLTLYEVTYSFGVQPEAIIDILNEGIVTAEKNEANEWQFDSHALKRIRTVLRLQRDLGVNLAGAGLAVELLEEIERLRLSKR